MGGRKLAWRAAAAAAANPAAGPSITSIPPFLSPFPWVQGEFDLDFFQDGFIATAMMVGIMISAPLSAQLSKRLNAIRLVGGGLGLWSLGAGCCALAPGYTALLAARGIVGLGCGPFISLAAPIVDDAAPRASRSLWLAILFLCIPSGFAFGFIWVSWLQRARMQLAYAPCDLGLRLGRAGLLW